jgi:L-asparaginase II
MSSVEMVEIWRGPFLESVHCGFAVVCDAGGSIVDAWGDPDHVILPRSSSKMLQALPLVRSGAADQFGLTTAQLALCCASHNGAAIHSNPVARWLADLDLSDADLRCGPQEPADIPARDSLIKSDTSPCQMHNNCSGKHCGFLTYGKFLGAGPEYVDPDHPVQIAVKDAFEEITEMDSPGFGVDGCSAPNYAASMHGIARAMAKFAAAPDGSAEHRLRTAMMTHPELVAGETRACTDLMRAMPGKLAVKTGAEGVFVGILPDQRLGFVVKIADGTTRAAEAVTAGLLARYGVLPADAPILNRFVNAPIRNRAGLETGQMRLSAGLA